MMRFAAVAVLVSAVSISCGRPAPKSEATTATASKDSAGFKKVGYSEQADPAKDLAALIPVARAHHKRILLSVGGEWCKWCHYLHDFLDREADIKQAWDDRFETLLVNWSPDNENTAFLSRFPKVSGYPHIFVLDENGALLHSQDTALLESGSSYSKEAVRAFLVKWSAASVTPDPPATGHS